MKKKSIYKIVSICIISIIIAICISNIANASTLTSNINPNTTATSHFEKPISIILGITQVIATGVGVIMIIALGIKYMSSASSDKAEVKKHAVIYLVGACIAFGAGGLIQIFKDLVVEMLS